MSYVAFLIANTVICFIRKTNPFRIFSFVLLGVFFIGLRLDTGFDWPVYKEEFETLSQTPIQGFWGQVLFYVAIYLQEPVFIALIWLSTLVLPSYELFQLCVFLFFMLSMYRLCKALAYTDIVLAMIIIHLFLLFTLEFSTLRQCIATSLFNIGLAYQLERQHTKGWIFFIVSPLLQSSTVMLIGLYQLAKHFPRRKSYQITLVVMGAIASLGFTQIGPLLSSIPLLGPKLEYYFYQRQYAQNPLEVTFMITLVLAIIYLLLYRMEPLMQRIAQVDSNMRYKLILLIKFCTILCAVFLLSFPINTIRNRVFYELVIVLSVMVTVYNCQIYRTLRYCLLAFGLLFFSVSIIKSTAIAYRPYQNLIMHEVFGLKSTGPERQKKLFDMIAR